MTDKAEELISDSGQLYLIQLGLNDLFNDSSDLTDAKRLERLAEILIRTAGKIRGRYGRKNKESNTNQV